VPDQPEPSISGSNIDSSIIAEAADVLTDLPQWQLGSTRWLEVEHQLEAMAQAVRSGTADDLLLAVARLEALSPNRVARLGDPLVGPPPPTVLLLRNRLIHTVGLTDLAPGRGPGRGPAPDSPVATRPEMVQHYFAPIDGPAADLAYRQLVGVWNRCQQELGTSISIPALGLPADPPASLDLVSAAPSIAAMRNRENSIQAILYREHDVLGLSVLCAPAPGLVSDGWPALERLWAGVATADTHALLGEVTLYLGLTADPDAAGSVPMAGCMIRELSEVDPLAGRRRLLVLAGPGSDDQLSAWAWSRGDAAPAPFTRYLLQASKVRYEARIRGGAEASLRPASDRGSRELTDLITRLDDLRLTTDVARRNMAALLGPVPRQGFVETDAALADWLVDQVTTDITYLVNERQRAAHGSARRGPGSGGPPTTPTFGLVTALPEELAAMRLLVNDSVEHSVAGDRVSYVSGTMPSADPDTPHTVVLGLLVDTANDASAQAVAHLVRSYPSIDQVIMVGIAAGVPAPHNPGRHVRVGDIIAATWGIVAYDHIVDRPTGPELRQDFPLPSPLLAHRARMLAANEILGQRPWEPLLDRITSAAAEFARPAPEADRLYAGDGRGAPEVAHPDLVADRRRAGRPKVHYGSIGSADRSLRNAANRDALANRFGVCGMEMEGKGLGFATFLSGREWFMVRGVSDYGDSHLDKVWRPYASAVAAAYVAALLARCPPLSAHGGHTGATTGA
jgi:nucleoside phosphorylase